MTPEMDAANDPGRPAWVFLAEITSVAVFAILAVPLATMSALAMWKARAWGTIISAPLLGYILADLASGTVHWFGDTFYKENTPLLGPLLIRTFREHHRDPESITRHGFFEVNGCNCLGLIPPLAFEWSFFGLRMASGVQLFCQAALLAFVLAVFATNQFHKWSHARRVPALVGWLQRNRLILSPEHHQRHHRGGFSRSYCITSGWLNVLLDQTRLFRFIERLVHSGTFSAKS
jgi:hypothetical protein